MSTDINPSDQEFMSLRRATLLCALFFVCVGAYLLFSCMLPHDPYIRYQQLTSTDLFRSRWVYERIHFDPTPIDVAIIGSSRVEAGVSAPELEAFLSKHAGHAVHVANLAVPNEGRNLHAVLVHELLAAHPETRVIFLSVVEQRDVTHPGFRYLASASDVLHAPFWINHFYFVDLAFLPYRQMSYFMQSRLPRWFGVSHTFRGDYAGTGFDTTHSFLLPSGRLVDRGHVESQSKLDVGSREIIALYGRVWRPYGTWRQRNNPLEPAYTQRLVDDAKAHCASVIFLRFPFYKSPEHFYDEAFYQKLGTLIDAQELASNASDYGDVGHFNRRGSKDAMALLEQQLTLRHEDVIAPQGCSAP